MTWFEAYEQLGTKQKAALKDAYCQIIGCTRKTFYLKLQNEKLFTASELRTLCHLYHEQAQLTKHLINKAIDQKLPTDDNRKPEPASGI